MLRALRRCDCPECLITHSDGRFLPYSTWRNHRGDGNSDKRRKVSVSSKAFLCFCDGCRINYPNGRPLTQPGFIKHQKLVSLSASASSSQVSHNGDKPSTAEYFAADQLVEEEFAAAESGGMDVAEPDHIQLLPTTQKQVKPEELIFSKLLDFYAVLDEHKASEALQDSLFKQWFSNEDGESLGRLLTSLCGGDWDGKIAGFEIPKSFKAMKRLLKDRGLPELERHTVCFHYHPAPANISVSQAESSRKASRSGKKKKKATVTKKALKQKAAQYGAYFLFPRLKDEDYNSKHQSQFCELCGCARKDAITFLYNPVMPRLRLRARSATSCYKDLEAWRDRHQWIGVKDPGPAIKHIWHSTKFRRYQDFFNPAKQVPLPLQCNICDWYIRTWPDPDPALQHIHNDEDSHPCITCPHCRGRTPYEMEFFNGDPRHLFLILHADGFQFQTTRQYSVVAINLAICNGDAADESEVLPIMYIPKQQLISGTNTYDVFYKLLVDELIELYVEGTEVEYAIDCYSDDGILLPRTFHQRVCLYATAADFPATCEITKLSQGGVAPCRRCHFQTRNLTARDIRKEVRHPPAQRDMGYVLEHLPAILKCKDDDKLKKVTGIRGQSVLIDLWHVYGFDICHDTAFDVMHSIPLCLLQKLNTKTRELLINDSHQAIALSRMKTLEKSRTFKLKAGRLPSDMFNNFGFWKAQEHQVFAQFYQCHVVAGLLSEDHLLLCQIAADICVIFFDLARNSGWTNDLIDHAKMLLQSYRIRWTNLYDVTAAPLDHVLGAGHILDDIRRLGPSDKTWCYRYERMFKTITRMKTNNKTIELSISRIQNRSFFHRICSMQIQDGDGLVPPQRWHNLLCQSVQLFSGSAKRGFVRCSKQVDAIQLWQGIHFERKWSSLLHQKSIVIGRGLSRKSTETERRALQDLLLVPTKEDVLEFKSLLQNGHVIRRSDNIVVRHVEDHSSLWYCKLDYVFIVECESGMEVLFHARYYTHNYKEIVDEATGMVQLEPELLKGGYDSILPVRLIQREVAIVPRREGHGFIALETTHQNIPSRFQQRSILPVWPAKGDIVLVQGTANEVWCARIDSVLLEAETVHLTWMTESRDGFIVLRSEKKSYDWNVLLKIIPCRKDGEVYRKV